MADLIDPDGPGRDAGENLTARVSEAVGVGLARSLGRWLESHPDTVGSGPWIIHGSGRVTDLGDHTCRWRDDSVRLSSLLYAAAVLLDEIKVGEEWNGNPDELGVRLLSRLASATE